MNRQPTDIPASLKNINLNAVLRKRGIYLDQKVNQDLKEKVLPIARKLVKNKKPQKYLHFTNEEAQAYWEKQIHIVDVLEAKFEVKLQQFINKMVDGFVADLHSRVSKNTLSRAKDYFDDNEDDLLVSAQLDFTPLLTDQAVLAGQQAYDLIKHNDVYSPDKLRQQIVKNVAKFTQSMIDTDRQKMVDILTEGLNDGKSIPEIRNLIQADFDNIQKTQAQLITRTEVLRVSNQASVDAYQQSGVVEGLQWLTAGADDECADYEGDIIALDSGNTNNFYDVQNEFQDGDPPLHPNCRCVLLPVLIDG